MSLALIVAVAGLVLSGSIGQSQPLSGSPIPWTEAWWCVSDSGGVVHLPGGWRVRGGTVEREKCEVEGIVFSDGDGDLFYFFSQRSELGRVAVSKDGLISGGVVARLHAWDLTIHAAPRSCKAGFAASARFFALDRKRREVRAWKDNGTDAGVVFSYAGRDEQFVSLAIHPASGDLLLGTGWPQNRICRFKLGGEEVRDHVWPASGYAMALGNSRGRTWVLGSDAMLLADSNAPSAKCRFGVHANEVRAIAETGKAYFLATTQGVQAYLKADLSRCARRIGGLANVGAVAVHDGRVLVGSGYRLLNFWLDDGPNDAVSSDVKWGIAKKWDERIDRMEVREGVFYIHDEVHGGTTAFDPRITEWAFRKRRQRDADGFDFKVRGDRARLGRTGDYAAVAKGDELRLYRREGGALALVQTLPVKATCIAGEGDWLVAYVPEKKALLRYRLSEQQ